MGKFGGLGLAQSNKNNQSGFYNAMRKGYLFFKKKDDEELTKKPVLGYRGRQLIILLAVIAFAFFVGYHLLKFTVLDGDKWRMLAYNQQTSELTIMANRGTIYDANGTVLAQSSTVWNIVIAPQPIYMAEQERSKEFQEKQQKWIADNNPEKEPLGEYKPLKNLIAEKLSALLGVKQDGMLKACEDIESYYYIVKRKVDKPVVAEIQKFMLDNDIPANCIVMEETSKRNYPNGTLAANVIGFTNFDGDGVYGLEAYYDEYLRGTDGKAFYTTDGLGQGVQYANDNYFSAVDGYSLVLTIDEVMQHYLEKNLEATVSQHSVINRACGIIMNCKTGGIVAMATSPSYDLNNPSELTSVYDLQKLADAKEKGASEEELDALEATLREGQWKNKAVTELYYPGSVFKSVSCAAGLDTESISMESEFTCTGSMNVAGTDIDCWYWYGGGHGTLTLQQALTKSCNPSFMQIGAALGADNFSNYFESFGFTEPTGIDLPGEAQSLYVPRSRMGPVELATSAFGQTNKITPIQMCTAYCALVNGGYLVTPHVVDKIIDSSGNVVETKETEIKRQVISKETSQQMCQLLETVVSDNGGTNAYIQGYRIGGKSGTAEKIDEFNAELATNPDAKMTYISTFAACVPMDDPQYVMLVMVDTPTGPEYYGSAVAAPIVSLVFSEGLEHLGIYPTYTAEEQAKMDSTVPYVVGYLSMKAESLVKSANFNVKIVGDDSGEAVVTNQVPYSGISIPKGSTIILYFNDIDPEYATVPNVIGMSADKANEVMTNAGFNIKISGGAAYNADAKATMQSFGEGAYLPKGTAIEVTFSVTIQDG